MHILPGIERPAAHKLSPDPEKDGRRGRRGKNPAPQRLEHEMPSLRCDAQMFIILRSGSSAGGNDPVFPERAGLSFDSPAVVIPLHLPHFRFSDTNILIFQST